MSIVNTEDQGSRSLSQAIEKGYEIVRAEEPVDLDYQEIMELWERFEERNKTEPLFDAVIKTAHEAFLCGVVFGRDPRAVTGDTVSMSLS